MLRNLYILLDAVGIVGFGLRWNWSGVKLVCFFIDLKVPLGPDWDEMQVPQSG
jgi:hypothetical protein